MSGVIPARRANRVCQDSYTHPYFERDFRKQSTLSAGVKIIRGKYMGRKGVPDGSEATKIRLYCDVYVGIAR